MISLTLPLQDAVSVIKAKLNDELGMPPGKQKLQIENIFLKDSNSLAFYNVTPGQLQFYILLFSFHQRFLSCQNQLVQI
jgi:splicing factor 3A subunit 1